jgi:hypothetical protein
MDHRFGCARAGICRRLPTLINYVAKSGKDVKFNSVDLVHQTDVM